MKKLKSNKKIGVALVASVAMAFTVIFAGCYNVIYEILERERNASEDSETVKILNGGGTLDFETKMNEAGQYDNLIKPSAPITTNPNAGTVGKDAFPYSYKYRVPTLVVLPAGAILPNGQKIGPMGRIVASGDNRFGDSNYGGGGDLPQKTSSWTRFSDDNGETWSNVVYSAHFDDLDMSTFQKSNIFRGTTAADPTIGRTKDNTLIVLSTFGPPMAGLHGGSHKDGWAHFKGSDGKYYLRLRQNTEVYDFNSSTGLGTEKFARKSAPSVRWNAEQYDTTATNIWKYAVPVDGGEIVTCTPTTDQYDGVQTIGTGIGLWADEYYRVYTDKNMTQPYIVPQLERKGDEVVGVKVDADIQVATGEKQITQCHLFYIMSPYVAWRGCEYTGMSLSYDGGVTWTPHKDITYMTRPKTRRTGYWFGSPCGGLLIENGKYAGRTIFSAYGNQERTAAFWTDDNGKTWEHSTDYIPGSTTSETSIIDIPDSDDLIAVGRGSNQPVQYAVSSDGGLTWKTLGDMGTPYNCGSEMISVTPLRKSTTSSGAPLYAVSAGQTDSATKGNRMDGKIHIVSLKKEVADWKFDWNWAGSETTCTLAPGKLFVYSCIRELYDGNLMCLWETENCNVSHVVTKIYLDRE